MSQKQKAPIQLTILLSLFAWAAAFYALWHQVSLLSGTATEEAMCNVNSFISCDTVALSPYSMILGMPLAAFAMAFYSVLLIATVLLYFAEIDKKPDDVKKLSNWIFFYVICALPISIFYAGISLFVIKSICLSCFALYILHFVIAALVFKIKKNSARFESTQKCKLVPFASGTVIFLLIVVGLNLFAPKMLTSSMRAEPEVEESAINLYLAQHLNNPQYAFKTENSPSFGPITAPVTIVTFSDFQCPYCKLAASIVPGVAKSYGDKVRLVNKDYPLSSECNPSMPQSGHAFACPAAKVAKCALKELGIEAYSKLYKSLYSKQEMLSTEVIKNLAIDAGLSETQVTACLTSLTIHEAIVSDVSEGNAAKVDSTPSIFVNGRRLEAAANPQVLRFVIDYYLKSAH